MAAPAGCVLNLSCTYAYVLLAVLLTLFLTCVAIFYIERRQRANFPGLPDGRVVGSPGASPRAWKPPGSEARLLSASVLRDARDALPPPPSSAVAAGPRPSAPAPPAPSQAAPSTAFSARGLPPRVPAASAGGPTRRQIPSVDASAAGRPLGVGTEVLAVAVDEAAGWCGRFGGQQAWFTYADGSSEWSGLRVDVGDVVTVVGLRLNSWCGASRGMTANFTLPAAAIGRAEAVPSLYLSTPGSRSFAAASNPSSPISGLR